MKKLLLPIFLLAVVSFQSYPQNLIQEKNGLSGSRKYFEQLLLPAQSAIQGNNLPAGIISKKIYKSMDIKGTGYRPVRVISDTSHKETYSYDASGNLSAILIENLVNGAWEAWSRYTFTYNSNGNTLTAHTETYIQGMVKDTYDANYTYDAKGNLLTITSISKMYGVFQSGMRAFYTYDSNGRLATLLYENAKTEDKWENDTRFTYTYDAKGNVLMELAEDWQDGTWKNSLKVTYSFDANGNVTQTQGEVWKDSLWVKGSSNTYTYNEKGQLLTFQMESWDGVRLLMKNRWTYSYDINGNMASSIIEQWLNNNWANYRKGVFTYDNHGNAVKGESFEWSADGKWIPYNGGISMSYNYGKDHIEAIGTVVVVEYAAQTAGIVDNQTSLTDYSLAQNYPNPFNPSTTISYSLKKEGNVKLTVYDALGKIVAVVVDEFKPAGSYSAKFEAQSLPSGIYIYRLEAGEFISARKFILMK
ncbi:MAG: T9SS type A sorting domain-containing protein [Acidobacteriota bacterium]